MTRFRCEKPLFFVLLDPFLFTDPMMFVAQTTAQRNHQADTHKKKAVACEHDQHLNATDGTVRCSKCSHTEVLL